MEVLSKIELGELWERLCKDPKFQNLGYKIEIQANGNLIMSPGNFRHSRIQSKVARLLQELIPDGEATTETAVQTPLGVLVPDVCWCSSDFIKREADRFSLESAPEICVEVMSPSNSLREMEEKRDAYFASGCEEFILVDTKGFVTFYTPAGQGDQCVRAPGFPSKIELPN